MAQSETHYGQGSRVSPQSQPPSLTPHFFRVGLSHREAWDNHELMLDHGIDFHLVPCTIAMCLLAATKLCCCIMNVGKLMSDKSLLLADSYLMWAR